MADDKIGPIGIVAPDWIAFKDVPKWIQHRFAHRLSERSMQDLFSIIRRDTRDDPFRTPNSGIVRYRVKGLTASNVRAKGRVSGGIILKPKGLRFSSHSPNSVAVASWDDAKFDPETVTVEGLYSFSAGRRERHEIEVCWVDVEDWFQRQRDLSGSGRDWGSASVHIDLARLARPTSSRVTGDQPSRRAASQSTSETETTSPSSSDTVPQGSDVVAVGPASGKRSPGRPGVKVSAQRLFEGRRSEGFSCETSRLAEAQAILARWPGPGDGPKKPKAETVARYISDLWQKPDKLSDKLPDKL